MHGIGGRTVAEAKQNLSAAEVALWAEYRKKRGTLNVGLRLEQLFALSDTRQAQVWGAKVTVEQMLRFHDPEPDEGPVTLMGIAKMFGAKVIQRKAH